MAKYSVKAFFHSYVEMEVDAENVESAWDVMDEYLIKDKGTEEINKNLQFEGREIIKIN